MTRLWCHADHKRAAPAARIGSSCAKRSTTSLVARRVLRLGCRRKTPELLIATASANSSSQSSASDGAQTGRERESFGLVHRRAREHRRNSSCEGCCGSLIGFGHPGGVDPERRRATARVAEPSGNRSRIDTDRDQFRGGGVPQSMQGRVALNLSPGAAASPHRFPQPHVLAIDRIDAGVDLDPRRTTRQPDDRSPRTSICPGTRDAPDARAVQATKPSQATGQGHESGP